MSIQTGLKLWQITKPKLGELVKEDQQIAEANAESKKELRDVDKLTYIFANLFLKYAMLVKDLGKVMEQMVQVQQRAAIKKVFDAANTRLVELKNSLCLVQLSQFIFLDKFLIEYRLLPHDILLFTPSHFQRDNRDPEMQELFEKIMQGIQLYDRPIVEDEEEEDEEDADDGTAAKAAVTIDDDFADLDDEESIGSDTNEIENLLPFENPHLSPEKRAKLKYEYYYQYNIRLIQTCERVRCARITLAILVLQVQVKFKGLKRKAWPPVQEQIPYAITIQRYWRGYNTRKQLEVDQFNREIVMRLKLPSYKSKEMYEKIERDRDVKHQRRLKQIDELKEFAEREETRIMVARTSSMMEDITDEIIDWMEIWWQRTNWFDAFPEAVDGGTVLVVTGTTQFIEEYLEEREEAEKLAAKYANDPGARQKDQADAKKKKAEEKKKKKELKKKLKALEKARKRDIYPLYKWEVTPGMEMIKEKIQEFNQDWNNIAIGEENPLQDQIYEEFISEEKYAKLNVELRKTVDDMMRVEYDLLVAAAQRDRFRERLPMWPKPKYKPPKKKKKKKEPKDITADRSIEDLFQELIDNGIVHPYPKVSFDDYISDWNYAAYDKQVLYEPFYPSTRDTIATIKTDCVYAMGSPDAPRPKGIVIIGPKQTGKKLLIHAVLNETGSVLFDLSPQVKIPDKYPGKSGLKMFTHLIPKMSKILQPSIIFTDGIEKPLYLGRPPPEELEWKPKALLPYIKGVAKQLKSTNMVMMLACSGAPWMGNINQLIKMYEKVIFLPRLDYGTCLQFWQKYLMAIHGVRRDFDVSSLAKKTVYYQLSYLRSCADSIFTTERIANVYVKPVTPEEIFYKVVSSGGMPVTDEEQLQYWNILKRTPNGMKDMRRWAIIQEELEKLRKEKEAAAKNKKK